MKEISSKKEKLFRKIKNVKISRKKFGIKKKKMLAKIIKKDYSFNTNCFRKNNFAKWTFFLVKFCIVFALLA